MLGSKKKDVDLVSKFKKDEDYNADDKELELMDK